MKPSRFALHIPRTLPEALDLVGGLPDARVLAGGQSLMPMLNMRMAAPAHLIDLNRIAELRYIRDNGDDIVLGAMTRQREIELSPLVRERLPLLSESILRVGHRQTRNRGTLGGSLCHLDPSAELSAFALAMDATLTAGSTRGSRSLGMVDFIGGLMTTTLAPEEVLLEIRVRPWAPGHGACFVEFARRHGDFAVVSASALIELDGQRRITRIALTLGGMGSTPVRLGDAERALVGGADDDATLALASAHAERCEARGDPAYPSWYRRRLAQRLLGRAIKGAFVRARPV